MLSLNYEVHSLEVLLNLASNVDAQVTVVALSTFSQLRLVHQLHHLLINQTYVDQLHWCH